MHLPCCHHSTQDKSSPCSAELGLHAVLTARFLLKILLEQAVGLLHIPL